MTTNSPHTPPSKPKAGDDADPLIQTPSGATVHVLIVEDDDTSRKMLAAMCELFDCASFLAKDGVEAVEAFSTMTFDIVLMDIDMPRMDGLEATRVIRAISKRGHRVPIIALTGSADPADRRVYLDAGMTSVAPKPIEASRLLEVISAALGSSFQRHHNSRAEP